MIKLIACIGPNGELGKNNDLVYSNKQDMKFFRESTKNNIVVMGKNTFLSLGLKPLPNRINVVLTDEQLDKAEGIMQIIDKPLKEVLEYLKSINYDNYDIYIIGGAYVYNQAIEQQLVDELLLTTMHNAVDADVFVDIEVIKKNYEISNIIDSIKEDNKVVGEIVKFTKK